MSFAKPAKSMPCRKFKDFQQGCPLCVRSAGACRARCGRRTFTFTFTGTEDEEDNGIVNIGGGAVFSKAALLEMSNLGSCIESARPGGKWWGMMPDSIVGFRLSPVQACYVTPVERNALGEGPDGEVGAM